MPQRKGRPRFDLERLQHPIILVITLHDRSEQEGEEGGITANGFYNLHLCINTCLQEGFLELCLCLRLFNGIQLG